MTTLVLVTPAGRFDGTSERFTPGHLRELSARFERVVVVLDNGTEPPDRSATDGTTDGTTDSATDRAPGGLPDWNGDRVIRTAAPLEQVLTSLGDHTGAPALAVLIDGDIRAVRRAGSTARGHGIPALWWCDGPPAAEIQRDTQQFIDAVLAPVDETSVGRYVAIGAGIDTAALEAVPLPPRPPLRLLVLGRAVNQGGLAVPLRALAETRAHGVDAHLVIVDSPRVSTRSARRSAESLVADLMLSQSVELLDADGMLSLPDVLRRAHAVIDAGGDSEVDLVVLEAMACGRAVLTSRPAFTPLLADEMLPLVFASGDATSLAACITALASARHDEIVDLSARVRDRVDHAHSLGQWGASVAAVVEALRTR